MASSKGAKAKAAAPAADHKKLARHPLSEKYGPKMDDDELRGLGLDIKAHGQHDDIIVFEGQVLAGWNRYMACLQQGVEPRVKPMAEGADPAAVAFGTNFLRRRLSSVQKAFYGARFCIDSGQKQADVAKLVGCNLNRLNQCVQLLKLETDDSKRIVETLSTNPDVTPGAFEEMMLEAGIAREKPASTPAPARTNTHSNFDDDDLLGGDDDDLTGGAIDSLLGGGDEAPDDETPTPRQRKGIGEDAPPLPEVGGKRQSMTNPHETPPSRVAKAFKSMSAEDQQKFVKFAWGKLRPALAAALAAGEVSMDEAPVAAAKPKGKAKPADSGKPDPSLIARNKPKESDVTDVEVKSETPAKKTAAKKAPARAKKTAAKKAKK